MELDPFLSIRHAHGDLCKHLGIDSSTDHPAYGGPYYTLRGHELDSIKEFIILTNE